MHLKHHFSPDTFSLLSRQPWAAFAKKKKKVFPPFCFSLVIKQLAHKMEVLHCTSHPASYFGWALPVCKQQAEHFAAEPVKSAPEERSHDGP